MNRERHQDWWPLSKQTVICFLVIPHSCYRRFLYNSVSRSIYEKRWCGLTPVPVPFDWRHRLLLEYCGNDSRTAIFKFARCNGQHGHHAKKRVSTCGCRVTSPASTNFARVKRLRLTGSGEAERYHGAAAESCPTLLTGGAWQQRAQTSL